MPNMSYCRFQNTANDLRDCLENIYDVDCMSDSESRARERLIELCVDIIEEVGHEIGVEVVEVDEE